MTAREYFESHVIYAVEVEREDGSRYWNHVKGEKELDGLLSIIKANPNEYLSDIDFGDQDEPFTDRVLKLALLNWTENRPWWKRNNLNSLTDVIYFILDNELYKA